MLEDLNVLDIMQWGVFFLTVQLHGQEHRSRAQISWILLLSNPPNDIGQVTLSRFPHLEHATIIEPMLQNWYKDN